VQVSKGKADLDGDMVTSLTLSRVNFSPHAADHGQTITCRAENVDMAKAIEDSLRLSVHCEYNLLYKSSYFYAEVQLPLFPELQSISLFKMF